MSRPSRCGRVSDDRQAVRGGDDIAVSLMLDDEAAAVADAKDGAGCGHGSAFGGSSRICALRRSRAATMWSPISAAERVTVFSSELLLLNPWLVVPTVISAALR